MFFEHTSAEVILFFILYGITGAMPFFAAVYLLLRRGNAFAPDVTPPVRLRRWAAAFFAVAALGHVWWYLFSSIPTTSSLRAMWWLSCSTAWRCSRLSPAHCWPCFRTVSGPSGQPLQP